MAHWAEIDNNNKVVRVIVTSNDEQDEGYQWIINNLGGTWIKTSYNTRNGIHQLGGTPLRGNYASPDYTYHSDLDVFMPPKEFASWVIDPSNYTWVAPIPKPDSGLWKWDEETISWKEKENS